ncbi:MAG TPA: hypothetical protein VHW71_03790 [Steroidobacteraceae bacterium]|nr:hypothetical protein [Steroidobacteraceae bacterium]
MTRQSLIGCVDEPQQLRAVAFKEKPASHELEFALVSCCGQLAERIGFNVCNLAAIFGGHRRLYPSANDGVDAFYANAP